MNFQFIDYIGFLRTTWYLFPGGYYGRYQNYVLYDEIQKEDLVSNFFVQDNYGELVRVPKPSLEFMFDRLVWELGDLDEVALYHCGF